MSTNQPRRALPRRTFLRGVGVTVALPWLESIPVWGATPLSGVAAAYPKRFAALFMGCGINPDHWWAKGEGASMELSKSLQPAAPLRAKLNVVNGLFNKNATGVGIHPGQTGNVLSGASLQKGAELKGGVSVGETDELGSAAVTDRFHVKNLHATVLHQMGLDPNKLAYFYGGLDQKLVGVEGAEPIRKII